MLSVEQIVRIINDGTDTVHPEPANLAIAQKIHDLCKPDHTIHIAAAALEGEVTSTLLDMTVATVLAKLIDQEGGGRTNFSFSPMDMASAMKEWSYTVEHDGMVRTVRIQPKNAEEWEEGDGDVLAHSALAKSMERASTYEPMPEDFAPPADASAINDLTAQPQADPHEYNRPLWAVRVCLPDADGPYLQLVPSHGAAAEYVRLASEAEIVTIENRWCDHIDCPSSGCLYDASKRDKTEVASDE